jgi:hypothetical protein
MILAFFSAVAAAFYAFLNLVKVPMDFFMRPIIGAVLFYDTSKKEKYNVLILFWAF